MLVLQGILCAVFFGRQCMTNYSLAHMGLASLNLPQRRVVGNTSHIHAK